MSIDITKETLVSHNMPIEYPIGGETRIIVGKHELILGKIQTCIWKTISESDVISIKDLYNMLREQKKIDISFDDLIKIIKNFLKYDLLIIREEIW